MCDSGVRGEEPGPRRPLAGMIALCLLLYLSFIVPSVHSAHLPSAQPTGQTTPLFSPVSVSRSLFAFWSLISKHSSSKIPHTRYKMLRIWNQEPLMSGASGPCLL